MISVKQELKQLMNAAAKGGKSDPSSENARMGQYKLNDLRQKTYKENIKGLDDQGRRNLQMSLINDYLSGYSGKLSL